MEKLNRVLLLFLENKKQILSLFFVFRVIVLGTDGPPGDPD